MAQSAVFAAAVGIVWAHLSGLIAQQTLPLARAAWGWSSPSPSPPMMPSPPPMMPTPAPPPSPPMVCGTWGAYGACSVTCGQGTQSRSRGGDCPPYSESRACDEGACPEPCGEWSSWASCSATCGGGTRSRSRSGGCSSFTESEACNSNSCPAACGWGPWSPCSATCGTGTRSRSRTGGCSGTESEACSSDPCPSVGAQASPSPPPATACGVWQQWSECFPSCGNSEGSRMRSRGGECQPFVESEACSPPPCAASSPPSSSGAPTPSATTTTTTTPTTASTTTTAAATSRPVTSNVVEVRMRIASDFSEVTKDIDGFREGFREAMATAGGISKDRVLVRDITPGSIVVDFVITGAAEMGDVSAAVAVQDLEMRLADRAYSWPAALGPMMASANVEAKKTATMDQDQLNTMVVLSSSSVFLTPASGYAAPLGCSCIAGEGVSQGCANHKGVSPPWCLVAAGCRESMEGAMGAWAFCISGGQSPQNSDGTKLVIASGNGTALKITSWLLAAIIVVQGLVVILA